MLLGLLGPEAPPALVVLLLLDLLHVGRREGVARFQLVEPGNDPFRCFRRLRIRGILEAPHVEPAGHCAARDHS